HASQGSPKVDNEGEATPPPFPTISTFLGIAAVMIVIWLLVYGPPFSASDRSLPSNNSEAGAPNEPLKIREHHGCQHPLARHRRGLQKLNPRTLIRNPVMFVVAVVSALTTARCSSGI
ncbi:hypothetical protein ACFSQT_30050, partial [Mesorhizobium calcicola]